MGEVLNIYQYQSVVFTSTTTGATPLTLSWNFPGGTPISGTGPTRTVFYNVPGNYSATLTATDVYGTTNSLTETNIIRVDPSSIIAGISGPIPSVVKMDEGYNVYDSSIGNPWPATSWYWQLPYGVTATTQNVGVTGYGDWYTLTGGYTASPGSTYNGTIYLTSGNAYMSSTSTSSIGVQKLGPIEFIGLNATGAVGNYGYSTGLTGGILTNPLSPGTPATIQDLGYPGTGATALALQLDLSSRSGPILTTRNQYFHSTNEATNAFITTGFYTSQFLSAGPADGESISGFLIINNYTYSTYSTIPVNNDIDLGEYFVGGYSNDFYLGNCTSSSPPGILNEVYYNRNYSLDLINYLIRNPYKLVFSGNLQYVNATNSPGMTFVGLPSGSNNNPALYSSSYLQSAGASGSQIYEVYITYTAAGGTPYSATASFGPLGSSGNDPLTSGNFYVAQDTSSGLGFATILNNAINSSSIPGGTASIVFEAQKFFNCDYSGVTGSGYDPDNYYGVALKVLDKISTEGVGISDNSSILSSPSGFVAAPFTAYVSNSQGSTETCTGIFSIDPSVYSPYGMNISTIQNSYLSIGGSIAY